MACAFVLRPAITLPSSDGTGHYVLTLVTGCKVEKGGGGLEHVIEGKGFAELPGYTSGHENNPYYDNNMSKIRQGRQATRGRERSAKKRKRTKIFFKLFMPWCVRGSDERGKEMLTETVHLPSKARVPMPLFWASRAVAMGSNHQTSSTTLNKSPCSLRRSLDLQTRNHAVSTWLCWMQCQATRLVGPLCLRGFNGPIRSRCKQD